MTSACPGTSAQAANRLRSANGQIEEFADLTTGPTAAVVHSSLAGTAGMDKKPPPLADEIMAAFELRRTDLREGLDARLSDLRRRLDVAIDAIEGELGIVAQAPSAQRNYLRSEPVHDMTQPREQPALGTDPT